MTDNPLILTLEEMGDLEPGEPVYLEMRMASWPEAAHFTGWTLFKDVCSATETVTKRTEWLYYFIGIGRTDKHRPCVKHLLPVPISTYGLEWRCWNGKPEKCVMNRTKWDG